ncbi:MAG TPA: hypothetical protein VFH77_16310 [Streptomyces sp.]|nr:hypothetical protein [Streptomyces sp.]
MADLFFYAVMVLLVTGLAVWLVFTVLLTGMALRQLVRAARWAAGLVRHAAARTGGAL